MKKQMIIVLFLSPLSFYAPVQAEPLAPSANLDKVFAMFALPEERQVPDAKDVAIPAYPGSQFCTIKKGEWGKTGWSSAHLLSTDSYDNVSSWYRNKLKAWRCDDLVKGESLSCSDKYPDHAGPYVLDSETSNVVEVVKMNVPVPCVMQGMKTAITIRFQPD